MWGFGGRCYWERKEKGRVEGIVVLLGWMSSQDKHLKNYVDLYSSHGWNSLVCHSKFLNLFFPDKAASLALQIADELVRELKIKPRPVVFASFSGAPKSCLYKLLQIIEGKCEEVKTRLDDEYKLVRECVSGHIFDSTPVDFVSDIGTRFVLSPTVLKVSSPPPFVSRIARAISLGLDALFIARFESQRAEYWQTLYATVGLGAPYLILCSEDDELAPHQVIDNFSARIEGLGADIKVVKWSNSPHVGHLRHHPEEYRASVLELLRKASTIYALRTQLPDGENMRSEGTIASDVIISEPSNNLGKTSSESSRRSFRRVALESNDDGPSSVSNGSLACHEDRDDRRERRYMPLSNCSPPPNAIDVRGVLSEFLFDSFVAKDVEDWDLGSLFSSGRGNYYSHFNPFKCVRRSRL